MNFGEYSFKSETYMYDPITNNCEIFYSKKWQLVFNLIISGKLMIITAQPKN
jgi:hypothetical protein